MTTRVKTPLETRIYPFNMDAQIPDSAVLSSVRAFISRQASVTAPLQMTNLDDPVSVGDTTINLQANPKAGALLILEPGSGIEERLKVISVSGASVPFIATVTPSAWFSHSDSANVSFEPGLNARMLVSDTPIPSGVNVSIVILRGCDAQVYRVSVVGTCNNGEVAEEEFDLQVTDAAPYEPSRIKQPTETKDAAADISPLLSEPHQSGATIPSATAFASATTTTTTTLAAQANPDDSTVSLVAHPGIGALLVIDPTGVPEKVYVSNVSGGGPYTATINPSVEFLHGSGANVTVYTGVTTNFLTAAASSVLGQEVFNRARRGASGKTFKVVWLVTTSQAELLQHSGFIAVTEV